MSWIYVIQINDGVVQNDVQVQKLHFPIYLFNSLRLQRRKLASRSNVNDDAKEGD